MPKQTLRDGAYLIGDPCYFLQDNDFWSALLKSCAFFTDHVNGVHTITDYAGNDHKCALFDTGGDGGFLGSDHFEYGVDSGTIGVFPVPFIMPPTDLTVNRCLRLCNQVYFDKPFNVSKRKATCRQGVMYDANCWNGGVIMIDTIKIEVY